MPNGLGIEPLKSRKFHQKQSRYEHLPETSFRWIWLGPGGAGKSEAVRAMLLNHYRGAFHFIAIWSPTLFLDAGWKPVLEYMEKEMGQKIDDPKHPCLFEDFKGEDLDRIVADQMSIIKKMKNQKGGSSFLPSILLIADDVADMPEVVRK